MSVIEIILLAAGGLAFVGSFFLPDKGKEEKAEIPEEELKRLVEEEIDKNRSRIDNMTEETVNYSMEKTERSLDRLANEKIMALGEYSDNVLNQIGSNHQEVVFLHDMLNRTKDELEDLLNRAERESKEANERANAAYTLAENASRLAAEVMEKTEEAGKAAVAAEEKMLDARRLAQDIRPAAEASETGSQADILKDIIAGGQAEAAEDIMTAGETADDVYADPDAGAEAQTAADEESYIAADTTADAELPVQPEETVSGQEEPDPEDPALKMLLAEASGASTEEELQALLDNAMSAAAEPKKAPAPAVIPDLNALDPEEERFFEDTQEMEDEDEEDDGDELSEEEMMEKLLREATAELAHDVTWVSAAGERKEKSRTQAKVIRRKADNDSHTADAEAEGDKDSVLRTSVKRKVKPKAARKTDDDEIEGQMSIPEEFMPAKQSPVSLQFGHDDGNSANHNERILEMHRMGRSNMAIAKDLGLGIGEVKLVIDLFENMS